MLHWLNLHVTLWLFLQLAVHLRGDVFEGPPNAHVAQVRNSFLVQGTCT